MSNDLIRIDEAGPRGILRPRGPVNRPGREGYSMEDLLKESLDIGHSDYLLIKVGDSVLQSLFDLTISQKIVRNVVKEWAPEGGVCPKKHPELITVMCRHVSVKHERSFSYTGLSSFRSMRHGLDISVPRTTGS